MNEMRWFGRGFGTHKGETRGRGARKVGAVGKGRKKRER